MKAPMDCSGPISTFVKVAWHALANMFSSPKLSAPYKGHGTAINGAGSTYLVRLRSFNSGSHTPRGRST
eukprot:8498624-Pyramimonas_sp.AAC.1